MAFGVLVSDASVALRRWFDVNKVEPGARLPSAAVLSEQLGLRYYALNRAMDRLISMGLVKREGYKLYRGPKEPPPASIVFSSHLVVSASTGALRSYHKVAKELGINLQVHRWECAEEAVAILHELDTTKTESVIFHPPFSRPASLWEPAVTKLHTHGIPVIAIGQYSSKIPCILPDVTRALDIAIGHLAELGHKQLALATIAPLAPASVEIINAWNSLCAQKGFPASLPRIFFQSNLKALREDAEELASKLTTEWSDVTGVVVYSNIEPNYLLEEFAHRHRHVPKDISIVSLGDIRQRSGSSLPIAMSVFDLLLIQETALRMVQGAARTMGSTLVRKPWCIRLDPSFVLADPKLPSSSFVTPLKITNDDTSSLPFKLGWEGDPKKLTRELDQALTKPYELTFGAKTSRFLTIDLTPHVNRPLDYRRGWLGDKPLKHFPAGQHRIHGIPFEVLGGTKQTSCGAVIFRSTVNFTGGKKELPTRQTILIGTKAFAVYILHGCGYTRALHEFATYTFYSDGEALGTVPLVSLGQTPPDFDPENYVPEAFPANIQDWWADYIHIDFPNARRVPIIDKNDQGKTRRRVCLYTLEWINPFPEKEITHLEISVDPNQSTTLGLLAVSVLKK